MSAVTPTRPAGTQMVTGEDIGGWETIRRGVGHSPELVDGIGKTLALAVVASAGQVIVPIAVQQTIDSGLRGSGGPDATFTTWLALAAGVAIIVTSWAAYAMTARLFSTPSAASPPCGSRRSATSTTCRC